MTIEEEMIEMLKSIDAAYKVDECGFIHVVLCNDTKIKWKMENGKVIFYFKKKNLKVYPTKHKYEVFDFPKNGKFTLIPKPILLKST